VVLAGLGAFLVTLAADVFLQMAAGFRASPVPSLARTAAIAVLLWGLLRVLNFCALAVPGDRYSLPLWKLTGAATLAPALEVIGRSALFVPLLLGPTVIAVAAAVRYLRRRSGYTLIAVLVALVALSRSTNLWQWLFYSVEGAVLIGLVVFLIRTCGVDLAGFGVAIFWLGIAGGAVRLIQQPAPLLQWSGVAALVGGLLLGGLFLLWMKSRRPPGTATSEGEAG